MPMRAAPHKTDSVVLVTGATDGIGKETALELARLGARVIVHGRTEARVAAAYEELQSVSETPPPEPVIADFASLAAGARARARADAARLADRHVDQQRGRVHEAS